MVFPCYYLAPVSYYALLLQQEEGIFIEQNDHYEKKTYRNRCRIFGGNGVIDLSVPIIKKKGQKTLMKDVRIDYGEPWQQIHWKSISSAYTNSPFFEYIEDSLHPFFKKKTKFLIDLNTGLLQATLDLLSIECSIQLSASFSIPQKDSDLFSIIHPKKALLSDSYRITNYEYKCLPYYQVFDDVHGFQKDLSILDLLCNMGNEARVVLRNSVRNT